MTSDKVKPDKKEIEKAEEKILFGEKMTTCFACGEVIKEGTKKCPYCETKQKLS